MELIMIIVVLLDNYCLRWCIRLLKFKLYWDDAIVCQSYYLEERIKTIKLNAFINNFKLLSNFGEDDIKWAVCQTRKSKFNFGVFKLKNDFFLSWKKAPSILHREDKRQKG